MIPPLLLRRMLATLGVARVHTGDGLTEATGVCTITRAGDPLDLVAESSGRAITGVDVRIVDDALAPVAAGERGQILVRGPGIIRGYLDDPDTAARRSSTHDPTIDPSSRGSAPATSAGSTTTGTSGSSTGSRT